MYERYADVLESYTIAEESTMNEITISPIVRKIFNKIGCIYKVDSLSYSGLSDLIEDSSNPERLTNSDLKKIHECFYGEEDAIDFFAPSSDKNDIEKIKKYKPIPIYSHGNGDHYCLTESLEIKEYIHDLEPCFDHKYAKDYKTYREWLEDFYNEYQSALSKL